ncbi:MAG: NifB/NifX family molybdenum-iron cluster-binding protein [Cellulomonas sp.]
MIVCVTVTEDGHVGGSWGRAHRVALAAASDGTISDWREVEVGWDVAHDEGTEGSHHARIARFLIDNHVEAVVTDHMGPPMARMLGTMGIHTSLGAHGDARAAVLAALDSPA